MKTGNKIILYNIYSIMSIFQQAQSGAGQLEKNLLGPPYDYKAKIKSPKAMGMSSRGTLPALGNDIRGLIGYSDVLVFGGGSASRVNGPLGSKFFLKTGGTCKDVKTKKSVPRYIYVNNVPNGPFAGLIKGTTTGIDSLNPYRLLGAFTQGAEPPCRNINLEVVDNNNRRSRETHYVTLSDIKSIEGFTSGIDEDIKFDVDSLEDVSLPDDPQIQLYFAVLALFGVYVVYKIMKK